METALIRFWCAVALSLAASLPAARAAPPTMQIGPHQYGPMTAAPSMRLAYSLTCRAQGTPVEFPDDIVIINNGPGTVPAGTKVHWAMVAPAHQGDYTFTAPLPPGKSVFLNGVLGGGVGAGTPCTVHALAQTAPAPTLQRAPHQYGPMQTIPVPRLAFSLTCRAQGTPVEFPDDIVIINNGPATVPAGTKIHWTMTAPAFQGNYTFAAALPPGKAAFIGGVLGGGVGAGTPCAATVVK